MASNLWIGEVGVFSAVRGTALVAVIGVLLAVSLLALRPLIGRRRAKSSEVAQSPPHVLQFPPSRRHVLASLSGFEKSAKINEIPPATLKSRALPTTTAADINKDDQYTPTGFSTQEIRALGRFPDYSLLSGVRPPVPCDAAWDISKAVFRPYRPFRWKYHQHMALMKFEPDWWIELEKNYHKTMAARHELLKEHSSRIFFQGPGADLAVRELMEMLLQFLCQRYPQHFSLSDDCALFHNRLLGTTTDLRATPPLRVIFDNVPEDYAIMLRNEDDGFYYLRAAMACSSVGWHIGMHRDKPLRAIHVPVPDADKMAMSMDRWFSKVSTDTPVNRCSWSIEDWEAMFTTPEVDVNWNRSAFAQNPEDVTVADLKLRCDAQTLRRLPLSGAVVFNFKAIFTPLEELRDEPFIPALLHKVMEEGKENLIEYKAVHHVRRVAMEALKDWADEQVEQGIVPENWDIGTLDESPFFPGWEEKWRRQQGLF
ncbi:hypothetical protein QBC34DRAFT_360645 [Podospora aff. communis PSN243]|uniref:Uncharacterized protein n=1 Tax=Podospora aff. communis PSN243 TaxID=3040156 RepID=A0AAV9G765_9PEZI|nr:hypothetical protein QBC34DRAFT_360645 [Podospora aff. communis PSN243]